MEVSCLWLESFQFEPNKWRLPFLLPFGLCCYKFTRKYLINTLPYVINMFLCDLWMKLSKKYVLLVRKKWRELEENWRNFTSSLSQPAISSLWGVSTRKSCSKCYISCLIWYIACCPWIWSQIAGLDVSYGQQ